MRQKSKIKGNNICWPEISCYNHSIGMFCMDREYFLQLTLGLYRVTELFPVNEPLRLKMRERAGDILASLAKAGFDLMSVDFDVIDRDLEVLYTYLDLAQEQNWVDQKNFFVLKQGYFAIQGKLRDLRVHFRIKKMTGNNHGKELVKDKKILPKHKVFRRGENNTSHGNDSRKKEIGKILQNKGPLRLIQILQNFPDINKRTLRRDLTSLVSQGILERYDEGKLTFYKLKKQIL